MTALRSLLVATDFSADAQAAARRAMLLQRAADQSAVTLLHVIEMSLLDHLRQMVRPGLDLAAEFETDVATRLKELCEDLTEEGDRAPQAVIRTGRVADVLGEMAGEFDLLLLGAHGAHPVRELALGTTAQRIIRQLQQPTLVVRQAPAAPYREIMVATDFSPCSARAMATAISLAPTARLHVVHVVRPLFDAVLLYANAHADVVEEHRRGARRAAEAALEDFLAGCGKLPETTTRTIAYGYAPRVLREHAARSGADLLVVGKHGRSPAAELLLGSVTQHVLAEASCDVLVAA